MLHETDEDDFPKQSDFVKGGDIIRIKHMELGGYLAADIPYETDYPEIYIDNYVGEHVEELNSVKYLWEVEIDDPE